MEEGVGTGATSPLLLACNFQSRGPATLAPMLSVSPPAAPSSLLPPGERV